MTSPQRPSPPSYSRRAALRSGAWAAGGLLLAACVLDGDEGEDDAGIENGDVDAERGVEVVAPSRSQAAPQSTATATPTPSLLAPESPAPDGDRGTMRLGVVGEAVPPPALTQARLVAVDPRNGEVHGDLALHIEQAGPLELVVRLRPGASFHPAPGERDGGPLDAAAVAVDFARRADAREFLFAAAIGTVETPEEDTLRLSLNAPFALLFELLGDTASAAVRAEGRSEFGQPIGAGPFIAERRADGGVSLRPHARYHQRGLPLLDELRMVSAERAESLDAAFEGGALDIHLLDQPDSVARAEQRDGARTLTRSTRRMRGLGLSLVGTKAGKRVRFHPAFQDERVRRALFLALDHRRIALREGAGAEYPTGPVGPSFAADALPRYELTSHPLFTHDPAEARKLLDAAGAPNLAFSLEAPDRAPFTILARALVQQLQEGGFSPRLNTVSSEQWRRDLTGGDFEAILFELEEVRTPDVGLRLHTSAGLSDFSPWGYSNPLYDLAVEEAMTAIDPAARGRLARDAQRLLLADVPALIPLTEPIERVAVSARVAGYSWDAHEFNETWQAARWRIRDAAARRVPDGAAASVAAL